MTRLSCRQFPMLQTFVNQRGSYMTIEDAQHWDQRPFRSMLIREWVAFRPGKGFYLTEGGLKAWDEFRHTEIARKDPTLPLTRYFDPTAYGLERPKKAPTPSRKRAHVA